MVILNLKLKDVEITNFLSYKKAKFSDFKNYNVLIGKNSSGKSNLFKLFIMLSNSYRGTPVDTRFLYDKNVDSHAEITLTFKISDMFREEIFRTLYNGNFLNNTFLENENRKDYLKRNEWNKKDLAVNWLLNRGYYDSVHVKIIYTQKYKDLILSEISIENLNINRNFPIYKLILTGDIVEMKIHNLQRLRNNRTPLENYFSSESVKKHAQFTPPNLKDCFEKIKKIKDNPIVEKIGYELSNCFFNIIHSIPDKRSFLRDSDISQITKTELFPNGNNLVKFIHKQTVTNRRDWLRRFNDELRHFVNDVKELSQDVNLQDRTFLVLKENDLSMDIELENMGAGILNVALFIAYIMELGENKILLIEEPEVHLHPGLERKLREKFLEESNKLQIFITTHSREFLLENEELCSIHLIQKEKASSEVVKISQQNNFKEIYNDLEMDIEKYKQIKVMLYDESFWKKFILKVMGDHRIESKLWDFKQTLEMWKAPDPKIKREKQIEFCEHIAAFGNNLGGALIIGISDKAPRKIIGLENMETKVKQLHNLIRNLISYKGDFVHFQPLIMKDEKGNDKNCLIIAIAQTKDVLGVRHDNGTYRYKLRIETGSEPVNPEEIKEKKANVRKDNYDFLHNIK